MAITEESRYRLYSKLQEVLGEQEASVLMEHLPPVGWADVATKRDVDHLEARLLGDIRAEFAEKLRTQLLALVGVNFTTAAAVIAAMKL